MESEERDKMQPRSDKSAQKNQRERISVQVKSQERTPIYRAVKDENGYQVRPQQDQAQQYSTPTRPTESRRPRISDSPARPSYNNDRYERPSTTERRPYNPTERRPYNPAERRPYSPTERRPYNPTERRPTGQSSSSYSNAHRPGGQKPAPYGSSNTAGRPPYAGRTGDGKYSATKKPNRPFAQKNPKFASPRPLKYKETLSDPNEPIRLNKFLANAGVCSRREADEFIKAGVVKVNGNVVSELGSKISRLDTIHFHDRPVHLEGKIYVLLNKPKNVITTTDDPNERRTVMELVKSACKERIYPVGRLDRNTTGVLLLTNDGDIASKLTHPSFKKKKIYHVWLDKDVSIADMERLANGIDLDDGEIHADALSYANEADKTQVGIEIHSGRNRIVRRMFEHLGYKVYKLDRVYFAGLTKKNLGRGKWRYLNEKEVNILRMGAFE
jgi:23S rRNA pseudouridine2605 synthase